MTDVTAELVAVAHAWDRAMVGNDADAIGAFMADEWTIIGNDGSLVGKAEFLALVRAGTVTHDVMESSAMDVRVYGTTAVMIARGVSGGTYQGKAFYEVERVTCVFVQHDGRWLCVLTHLSKLNS